MFRMDTNRRVATLAVVAVLSVGGPLSAAGWEMPARWTDSGDFLKSFARVLIWLGVSPSPGLTLKCDGGMGIDPNGLCLKPVPGVTLKCDAGSGIDPNGCPKAMVGNQGRSIDPKGTQLDVGSSIDPNGLH